MLAGNRSTNGKRPPGIRRVVVLAQPQVDLLDLAGPCEVFGIANFLAGDRTSMPPIHYEIEIVSTGESLQIETVVGVLLTAHLRRSELRGEIDTILIPAGPPVGEALGDQELHTWLRGQAATVRRIGSICAGALLLAAAGLLDGRRATTHWAACAQLAREYPAVKVEPDAIFVKDGHVYTSAGSTAGMDLALALVEEDLGREYALEVARHLVMFVRRPGGQSQFSPLLEMQAAERLPLRDLQTWILDHLDEDLSVERLAERVHMSPRNFSRVFMRDVGWTPARFVERLRVDMARRMLEETDAGIERIARNCGFGGADSMRRSFLRVLRVPPQDYRRRFQVPPQ